MKYFIYLQIFLVFTGTLRLEIIRERESGCDMRLI